MNDPLAADASTATSPLSVNFVALPTRSSRTCAMRRSSPRASGKSGGRTDLSASCLPAASGSTAVRTVLTTSPIEYRGDGGGGLGGADMGGSRYLFRGTADRGTEFAKEFSPSAVEADFLAFVDTRASSYLATDLFRPHVLAGRGLRRSGHSSVSYRTRWTKGLWWSALLPEAGARLPGLLSVP